MKKPIAIILIGLIVLNTMGFYGIFLGLKYHNTVSLNQRLDDEEYLESQTITFKIPISLAYYPNTDYQRVTGEIEYEGAIYHLVKQRYFQDALYIVCYKDSKSTELNDALTNFILSFGDKTGDAGSVKSVPTFIKDYITNEIVIQPSSNGWQNEMSFCLSEPQLISISYSILSPPPEA